MSEAPAIRFERVGHLARLTLANPARRNAMSYAMWRAIPDLVARAEEDEDVRAIVLQGEGETFCAGADISEFGDNRSDQAGAQAYEDAVKAANHALLNAAKPTIALIRGVCYGGGVGLALACDLRLARDDARFRVPAARLGLGYAFANLELVVARIGFAATADLLFSARVFDANEAERDGIVRRVYAAGDFDRATGEYLQQIAGNAPLTLVAAKKALVELMRQDGEQDLQAVTDAVARCFASQDYIEGRKAFAERREPEFHGR
jgi:enoyl-CoA hydratase